MDLNSKNCAAADFLKNAYDPCWEVKEVATSVN